MEHTFKLFEFNIYNDKNTDPSSDGSDDDKSSSFGKKVNRDKSTFVIQMFGINEQGEKASITVQEYQPFFYVRVDNSWGQKMKTAFVDHLKAKIGTYYENSIVECKLIERQKLYEFDAGKLHRFILIKFANVPAYNKVKNLWYKDTMNEEGLSERCLIDKGYLFKNCFIELYEAHIPPLLRFFHLREISPSGWVALPHKKTREIIGSEKKTTCDYEFVINSKNVIPLNDKETRVPYKIMSFDIEASSSHGDFPVPIKSYKKLATNIVDYFVKCGDAELVPERCKQLLSEIIRTAFNQTDKSVPNIDLVYPKSEANNIDTRIEEWLKTKVRDRVTTGNAEHLIESLFENANKAMQVVTSAEGEEEGTDACSDAGSDDGLVEEDAPIFKVGSGFKPESYKNKQSTIVDIMCDKKFEREGKIMELIVSLRNNFPQLEGDKATFIGSTFTRYGEKDPYLNHCIVLNTCDTLQEIVPLSEIETYETEAEVLCAWTALVQRENPDIVIGYNIFSFDYEFMFRRAQELNCVEDFLKLSRNQDELCATVDYKTGKLDIDRSSTTFASGTYDLSIIKMNGRLQVDMLNWFRRTENLTSYKLDYVGGHFIGDYIKGQEHLTKASGENTFGEKVSRFKTANMTGLQVDSFIHFEEINHSSDYYKGGDKFRVSAVNKEEGWFEIDGHESPVAKSVKWGLAKDDVTPKDIFRMTNEGPSARSIIAKYCIQDCNLVQHLFAKVDVVTDLVEMSKLCSVPMSFLIYRGQGIKLTSYVAKKCKEKGVLMPVINKGSYDDGYEGAIVLEPKCGLYLDTPVPVGDFASLYPSSMLSENLCPSSKVWTKIYDLANNLIADTGQKDLITGQYIYDNLPGYEYVDITFDTYRYVRKSPKAKAEKIRSGHKVCRFAQPLLVSSPLGLVEEKAIMPSILQELLKARKDTRKQIPLTQDDFMKNVLDKRQLAYKVTANSLYGQLGAKTSTFYEPDIAASTTATGRLLLTYAKRVVEECYEDIDIDTKYGLVNTKAEYVYGDSVANYTPVYIKVEGKIDILIIEQLAEKYGQNLWIKCVEPGKQEKEFCELEGVETWTEKGWTKLYRVIRHALAPWKKMVRILTHTGCVDVTDDHSLITKEGKEISPNDLQIGLELLHHSLREKAETNFYTDEDIVHFDDTLDIASKYRVPIATSATEYGVNLLFDNMLDAAIHTNYLNHRNIPFSLTSCPDLSIIVHQINTKLYNKYNPNSIKSMEEIPYEGYVYDLTTDNHHFAAGVGNMIVHNTDSVFFKFNLLNKETGEPILGHNALELSIEIAQSACHTVSKFLKQPHDFEYEKTFMPFCLLSKKRYVGIKYETDPNKGKRNEMGIVLKRRDNAPIVKDIYGGIIDILMKECNVQKAIEYVNQCLQEMVDGNVSMEKLIITKSLRSFYKNPQQIAHKVLADRIAAREPGNKPTSGDRIPFAYIVQSNKKALQGEKIETPTYIKEKGLQLDYSFYITNQIMKPLLQLFGLVLEDIWRMQNKSSKISKFRREINQLRSEQDDNKKFEDKLAKMRDKEVKTLIFDKYLRETNNAKEGNQSVAKFFIKK
jgi:DNA polymerase elongation subunit (family B)